MMLCLRMDSASRWVRTSSQQRAEKRASRSTPSTSRNRSNGVVRFRTNSGWPWRSSPAESKERSSSAANRPSITALATFAAISLVISLATPELVIDGETGGSTGFFALLLGGGLCVTSRLTVYYSLLTTYYAPLTTYYLLRTTYYLLLTTYYSTLMTDYLLPTTYYLLLGGEFCVASDFSGAASRTERLGYDPVVISSAVE